MLYDVYLFTFVLSSSYLKHLCLYFILQSLYPFIPYLQELAGLLKLSPYSSFSLFECCKVVTGSKEPDLGNGMSFFLSLFLLYYNQVVVNCLIAPFIVT